MATKDQQVREIVDGMGLGLVALGVAKVPSSKISLELAFSHAWRRWSHAGDYPSIGRAAKPDNLFWLGIGRSSGRQWSVIRWRLGDGGYALDLGSRTLGEAVEDLGDRPLSDWRSLAEPFLSRLNGER